MIYKSIFSSALGFLEICADSDAAVSRIYFTSTPSADYTETAVTRQAAKELEEYFAGTRREFSFAIAPQGTDFAQQVWQACREIAYGSSKSCKELAAAIGDDKAAKKVEQAVDLNPIAIAIPTHRVTRKTNFLTGFSTEAMRNEALRGAEKEFNK